MLSIVRSGTRVLRIEGDKDAITAWLKRRFGFSVSPRKSVLDGLGENSTVLVLGEEGHEIYGAVDNFPDVILAAMLTDRNSPPVTSVRRMPRVILFRIQSDYEAVMEDIAQDFDGVPSTLDKIWDWDSDQGVIVCFTGKSLSRPLAMEDLKEKIVLISAPHELLRDRLRRRALYLFNHSMDRQEWRQLEIHIYDACGRYNLHVERLTKALDDLEIGLVMGEGWGKDYAHILMPLPVYCLRLYSCFDPKVVKKALIGLEYVNGEDRFADFDLYENRKKISWTEVSPGRFKDRKALGAAMRQEVIETLEPDQVAAMKKLEREIIGQARKSAKDEGLH